MADLSKSKFVKYTIAGNDVVAKLIEVKDAKTSVELPSGQKVEVETAGLEGIEEDAYFARLVQLIESVQAQLRPVDLDKLTTPKLVTAIAEVERLKADLNKIQKDRITAERVAELKALDGLDLVAATEADALPLLAAMSDLEYAAMKKGAEKVKCKTDAAKAVAAAVTPQVTPKPGEAVPDNTNPVLAQLATPATDGKNEVLLAWVSGVIKNSNAKR